MALTVAGLTGYVDRDLDADLARWFADEPPISLPADTRPVEPFLERLPADAARALAAFDQRVRSGKMPQFIDVYDWSYAFAFGENECGIVDSDYETQVPEEDVFAIAADGSANLHVVLADGRVAHWFHEEEVLEGDTRYDTLDVFLWSIVRYQAVRAGRLTLAEIEADFRALDQPGAVHPELGLLRYLK
ncbi:hypothetical protein ACQPZX_11125 [Actinoplanes sp. CA-142083]|uniref:hypothetical protein n=1 Tax=Actinoplanes sp. CA-142083 TaxID=3239903 RepID=UPI003D8B8971